MVAHSFADGIYLLFYVVILKNFRFQGQNYTYFMQYFQQQKLMQQQYQCIKISSIFHHLRLLTPTKTQRQMIPQKQLLALKKKRLSSRDH